VNRILLPEFYALLASRRSGTTVVSQWTTSELFFERLTPLGATAIGSVLFFGSPKTEFFVFFCIFYFLISFYYQIRGPLKFDKPQRGFAEYWGEEAGTKDGEGDLDAGRRERRLGVEPEVGGPSFSCIFSLCWGSVGVLVLLLLRSLLIFEPPFWDFSPFGTISFVRFGDALVRCGEKNIGCILGDWG